MNHLISKRLAFSLSLMCIFLYCDSTHLQNTQSPYSLMNDWFFFIFSFVIYQYCKNFNRHVHLLEPIIPKKNTKYSITHLKDSQWFYTLVVWKGLQRNVTSERRYMYLINNKLNCIKIFIIISQLIIPQNWVLITYRCILNFREIKLYITTFFTWITVVVDQYISWLTLTLIMITNTCELSSSALEIV